MRMNREAQSSRAQAAFAKFTATLQVKCTMVLSLTFVPDNPFKYWNKIQILKITNFSGLELKAP